MIAPNPPVDTPVDSFSNEVWRQGQRRIDYDKCKLVERDGIPTVWPKDFTP